MLTRIDHVILAVRDLDVAVARFRDRFGFLVITGGRHPEFGTANAIVPCNQGYLELITVVDEEQARGSAFGSGILRFLAEREGLIGFALESSELSADVELLRQRGSSVGPPQRGEAARNGRRRGWISACLPESTGTPLPFLIQHDQPTRPRWSGWADVASVEQPFGVRAVEEVTVVVADLDRALGVYRRELGLAASRVGDTMAQIAMPGSRLNLVAQRAAGIGAGPGLLAGGLGVSDITACRDSLRRAGIRYRDDPFTWAVAAQVDPAETFGARIDFVQA